MYFSSEIHMRKKMTKQYVRIKGMIVNFPGSCFTHEEPIPETNGCEKYLPKSIPTIFGLGGGKYCWAKYPASNSARVADPERT